jgi:AraC-like DNA-binding protein
MNVASMETGTPKPATIALITDFFNPGLLEGARAYAEEHNVQLDGRWSVRADWVPEGIRWDGIIHALVDQPDHLRRLQQLPTPSIGLVEGTAEFCVVPDYEICGRLAAEELVQYGVAHALVVDASLRAIDERFVRGAELMLREQDCPCNRLDLQHEGFQDMVEAIVARAAALPKPLGLCIVHAGLTFTVVHGLRERGLRIPEDVAIVVVDKDVQQTAAYAPVPLSSVELNEWQRGFVAAELLHHMILGERPAQDVFRVPPYRVHRRASTGHVEARDPIMAKALSFLRKHYREGIGVSEVVAAACASRRAVEMRFRHTLNRGIHQELTRLRMDDAKRLLLEGELSATLIAETCGFSSVHYFSAAFKRATGLSPRQFQKKPPE